MRDHIVSSYDDELQRLREALDEMGALATSMLDQAMQALIGRDADLAQSVIAADARLDDLQRDVEERAILTIMKRQPLAIDLRQTVSAIRLSGDLERIGDLAKNIGKRTIAVGNLGRPEQILAGLSAMADLVATQLADVLAAYAQRDAQLALDVWRRDGAIDALYNALFRELLTYMMEDPRNITFCAHLLFCAKNIERIGDHTTNIAETVHYLVTGASVAGERPKTGDSFQSAG